ncbi:hypothetical protein QKW35_21045 [Pontibacterium granulatum]|uniref:hypothetical protein n=1 Tax=Pontibacterium granulatum TaxID=2036029 RepID=UPI00249A89D0|nr:hypothetical protein [Pontibacterium granulatum]MDI3326871.1 hypothetical protein [Pontibacterium granulatum]
MKKRILVSAVLITFVSGTYAAVRAFNHAVDLAAGEVVERTLSDNTIAQLRFLSEVEETLKQGNLQEAQRKLTEAKEDNLYILHSYCQLPKCVKAVKGYSAK